MCVEYEKKEEGEGTNLVFSKLSKKERMVSYIYVVKDCCVATTKCFKNRSGVFFFLCRKQYNKATWY